MGRVSLQPCRKLLPVCCIMFNNAQQRQHSHCSSSASNTTYEAADASLTMAQQPTPFHSSQKSMRRAAICSRRAHRHSQCTLRYTIPVLGASDRLIGHKATRAEQAQNRLSSTRKAHLESHPTSDRRVSRYRPASTTIACLTATTHAAGVLLVMRSGKLLV
jgi:hypothetical protein